EPRDQLDLAPAQAREQGGPLGEGKLGTLQGTSLPEGLEALSQGGVVHAQRMAELGLLEPLDQQEKRRPQGGREHRERGALDAILSGGGVAARGFFRDALLAGPSATGAAGEEGAMESRGAAGAAQEGLAVEVDPALQGGEDDVVREIL